jgi:hypothetical protein
MVKNVPETNNVSVLGTEKSDNDTIMADLGGWDEDKNHNVMAVSFLEFDTHVPGTCIRSW